MIYKTAAVRKMQPPRRGYQGILRFKSEDGRWHQKTKMLEASTKGEAQRELARWRDDEERVASAIPSRRYDSSVSVADYVDHYIDGLENAESIERSTVRGYRGSAKLIREAFSKTPLLGLTPADVKEWEAALTGRGLSSSTVGKAHRMLKQVLKDAVLLEVIDRNPVDAVKPPKRRKKNPGINSLDSANRHKLLNALESMEMTPITVSALIALYTGLREAEVCGLQWRDFDLKNEVLWVRRSIGLADGGAYVKETKTDRVRDVVMPATLRRALREWRFEQQDAFDEGGFEVAPQTFIVGNEAGFLHPSVLSRGWRQVAAMLGLKGTEGRQPTFHDLRHTWATVFIANGGDVKTASNNLGHANASMTLNVYASVDPDAKRAAADIVERAMGGGRTAARPEEDR